MKIFKLFEDDDIYKVEKSLRLLGIENIDNKIIVLNEISKYLFDIKQGNCQIGGKKNFDIYYDYQYYFIDFLKYNINLNKEDIDWWEFTRILNGILIDNNSIMTQIIKFRSYEKAPKNIKSQQEMEHKYWMQMKRKYALPEKDINVGFNKLYQYLELKVGETKE